MKKKILYLLPFALYLLFYLFIIILSGGIENLIIADVLLLLGLAAVCGFGFYSKNLIFNIIGTVCLFLLSFGLIKVDVQNTYFAICESIVAIITMLYYLIIFSFEKNKKLLVINLISTVILLILFLPIKFQYRDGGTVDYRALTYRVIDWNKLNNDGTYYKARDVIFFPNNFHSIEYYELVELPNTYVSVNNEESKDESVPEEEKEIIKLPDTYVLSNNQEIKSFSGTAQWSKVVDGKTISAIFDGIDPRDGNYKQSLIINNKQTVSIKADYEISDVKIQNINKEDNKKYQVQYEKQSKNIKFNNIENGTYVVTYKIENNTDYAYYSFKVIIEN